jgi:hypothetical protein
MSDYFSRRARFICANKKSATRNPNNQKQSICGVDILFDDELLDKMFNSSPIRDHMYTTADPPMPITIPSSPDTSIDSFFSDQHQTKHNNNNNDDVGSYSPVGSEASADLYGLFDGMKELEEDDYEEMKSTKESIDHIEHHHHQARDRKISLGTTADIKKKSIAGYKMRPTAAPTASARPTRGRPLKATSDTKQAVYARNYRQKNKTYIDEIERELSLRTAENEQFRAEKRKTSQKMAELSAEVVYLRNVIANQSTLAPILNCLTQNNIVGNKLQFGATSIATNNMDNGAGVCLHVVNGKMSVELCGTCNRKARTQNRIAFSRLAFERLKQLLQDREM